MTIRVTGGARLDAKFIGKAPKPLKMKPASATNFFALPFVSRTKDQLKGPINWWDVPCTGGYLGGYETGESMALLFIKFLREKRATHDYANYLCWIVKAFAIRIEEEGGNAPAGLGLDDMSPNFATIAGQKAGFFGAISELMISTVHSWGKGSAIDRLSERGLINRANAGLGFDEVAYLADEGTMI